LIDNLLSMALGQALIAMFIHTFRLRQMRN